MSTYEGWTVTLAMLGAITGLSSLAWNIINAVRDRGNIKVFGGVRQLYGTTYEGDFLALSFVNDGRRTLYLEGLGFKTKDGMQSIVKTSNAFPVMLAPGQRHTEALPNWDWFNNNVLEVVAWDSLGKYYYYRGDLLNKEIAKANEGR